MSLILYWRIDEIKTLQDKKNIFLALQLKGLDQGLVTFSEHFMCHSYQFCGFYPDIPHLFSGSNNTHENCKILSPSY